jgi:hypothetical protein
MRWSARATTPLSARCSSRRNRTSWRCARASSRHCGPRTNGWSGSTGRGPSDSTNVRSRRNLRKRRKRKALGRVARSPDPRRGIPLSARAVGSAIAPSMRRAAVSSRPGSEQTSQQGFTRPTTPAPRPNRRRAIQHRDALAQHPALRRAEGGARGDSRRKRGRPTGRPAPVSSSTTVNQRCPGGSVAESHSTAMGSPSVP